MVNDGLKKSFTLALLELNSSEDRFLEVVLIPLIRASFDKLLLISLSSILLPPSTLSILLKPMLPPGRVLLPSPFPPSRNAASLLALEEDLIDSSATTAETSFLANSDAPKLHDELELNLLWLRFEVEGELRVL